MLKFLFFTWPTIAISNICGIYHIPFLLITTHKAIEIGDVSAVKHWLVEEGTDVNECRGGRASNGHFFVGDGTALHWAAYYGQLEIVNLLLDKGASTYFNSLLVAKSIE